MNIEAQKGFINMLTMLSTILAFYIKAIPVILIAMILFCLDEVTILGAVLVALCWPLAILYIVYDLLLLLTGYVVKRYTKQ